MGYIRLSFTDKRTRNYHLGVEDLGMLPQAPRLTIRFNPASVRGHSSGRGAVCQ